MRIFNIIHRAIHSTGKNIPDTLAFQLKQYRSNSKNENIINTSVHGWIRTVRIQKDIAFANLVDGSQLDGIQLVMTPEMAKELSVGAAMKCHGILCASKGKQQDVEFIVKNIDYIGQSPVTYPLQKKQHSVEFIREHAHLRSRTKDFMAIFTIRSYSMMGFHEYFQSNEFKLVNTPFITGVDCEGGGETFRLCNDNEFFNCQAHLTVSGQLHLEAAAHAFTRVYNIGPTFRADLSHTTRHLSEFWMLEAEVSFIDDLDILLNLVESSIKYTIRYVLNNCQNELEHLDKNDQLIHRLKHVLDIPFHRITYDQVFDIIKDTNLSIPHWDQGLGTEHEQYIAQVVFNNEPVFITEYPEKGRAFYMKLKRNGHVVALNADLIIPGVGELMGASLREHDLDILSDRIKTLGLNDNHLQWYLELRKYGTVPHGGFGIGFDRFVQWITGTKNIKDTILIPRTQGTLRY